MELCTMLMPAFFDTRRNQTRKQYSFGCLVCITFNYFFHDIVSIKITNTRVFLNAEAVKSCIFC